MMGGKSPTLTSWAKVSWVFVYYLLDSKLSGYRYNLAQLQVFAHL